MVALVLPHVVTIPIVLVLMPKQNAKRRPNPRLPNLYADYAVVNMWHQRIDGANNDTPWVDWPCTDRYVELVGQHLGLPVPFQCREGVSEGSSSERTPSWQPSSSSAQVWTSG